MKLVGSRQFLYTKVSASRVYCRSRPTNAAGLVVLVILHARSGGAKTKMTPALIAEVVQYDIGGRANRLDYSIQIAYLLFRVSASRRLKTVNHTTSKLAMTNRTKKWVCELHLFSLTPVLQCSVKASSLAIRERIARRKKTDFMTLDGHGNPPARGFRPID